MMAKSWILASLILLVPLKAAAAEPTGLGFIVTVDLAKSARPQTTLKETKQALERRLEEAGSPDALVKPSRYKKNLLIVVVPNTEDPERILRLVQPTGFLELRLVRFPALGGMAREEILYHFGGRLPAHLEILEQRVRGDGAKVTGKVFYAVERRPLITSANIETARPDRGQNDNPIVEIRFTEDAAEVLGKETEANIGSSLAFVLDGKVVSAPVIRARIEDEGILEGSFTEAEVDELAMLLRAGPLPAPVQVGSVSYSKALPSRQVRYTFFGGCAFIFLLFLATLVWLYRRSDPARRARPE
ncbi:MAG: preprotein translocase subunit SecD [Acidobacteriota bacterium]|jgi:preprotein translocase subunit SecD|nr:preprotein translocase subunit SecD [Acidobacteriota bacterium]